MLNVGPLLLRWFHLHIPIHPLWVIDQDLEEVWFAACHDQWAADFDICKPGILGQISQSGHPCPSSIIWIWWLRSFCPVLCEEVLCAGSQALRVVMLLEQWMLNSRCILCSCLGLLRPYTKDPWQWWIFHCTLEWIAVCLTWCKCNRNQLPARSWVVLRITRWFWSQWCLMHQCPLLQAVSCQILSDFEVLLEWWPMQGFQVPSLEFQAPHSLLSTFQESCQIWNCLDVKWTAYLPLSDWDNSLMFSSEHTHLKVMSNSCMINDQQFTILFLVWASRNHASGLWSHLSSIGQPLMNTWKCCTASRTALTSLTKADQWTCVPLNDFDQYPKGASWPLSSYCISTLLMWYFDASVYSMNGLAMSGYDNTWFWRSICFKVSNALSWEAVQNLSMLELPLSPFLLSKSCMMPTTSL